MGCTVGKLSGSATQELGPGVVCKKEGAGCGTTGFVDESMELKVGILVVKGRTQRDSRVEIIRELNKLAYDLWVQAERNLRSTVLARRDWTITK